jgi:hypothetical protein
LQPYREAYNPKGEIVAQTKKSTLTILKALPNDLFETTQADFQKAVRQDFQVTQGKTYNVSGTDLLDAIEENTRSGHTAGADNNKNGAFDPSRDRHGLGKVVDKFTDKMLDNPIVRTVAQIAQFTPFAPVASVVNTVITARDVVKAVDEGNIKSLASTVIGAGLSNKLSNSLNLAGNATKISVAQQLQKHALDSVTRATVSTVVAGEDFDDQLKFHLKASAATIISQIGANKIGDLYSEGKLNNVTHKLAHTALGFAAGTAANGDGFSGAVGGLAGSVAGEYFQSENAAVLASAASAALLGKDPLFAANVASTADRFNRQLHQTEVDWVKVQAKQLAKEKGITEAEALKLLMSEAVQLADYTYEQLLPDNREVRAWLKAQGEKDGKLQEEQHWLWGTKTEVDGYFNSSINREVVSQNAGLYAETVGISPERAATLNHQNLMGEWGEGYNDTNVKEIMDDYQTVAEFVLPDIMLIPNAYAAYKLGQYGQALVLAGMAVADAHIPGKVTIKDEVVQMWAFQGGRGDTMTKVLNNPDPTVRAEAATGHVGISQNQGKSIHSFIPDVPSGVSKADAVATVRNRETYAGRVTDDTALFNDIMSGRYDPTNAAPISMYKLDIPVSPTVWKDLEKAIQSGEIPNVRYGFPGASHPTATVRNCATAFGECGLPLPSDSGYLKKDFIPAMIDKGATKVR